MNDILSATGGELIREGGQTVCSFVSTDTRTLKAGDLFFALKGDKFDAHNFIEQAFSKGCGMVVVSEPDLIIPERVTAVLVDDTITALGDLAGFYRRKLGIPLIAVTGSNGKTTTKDMLGGLLDNSYRVALTDGTKNNFIGVPLTLFSADLSHDVLVMELGINRFGEMERLGAITKPDFVIITNIGVSHIEFLENEEGVFLAKSEILEHLDETKTVILNHDCPFFKRLKQKAICRIVSFGLNKNSDFRAENVTSTREGLSFDLYIHDEYMDNVSLKVHGRHNVMNFLGACCAAYTFGARWENMKQSISELGLPAMRMEIIKHDHITIINDAYNANPVSTMASIKELLRMPTHGKRIMVFADMLELGEQSGLYHRRVGMYLDKSGVDVLITVGKEACLALDEIKSKRNITKISCNDTRQVLGVLRPILDAGDVVLFKGSRANRLESVIDELTSEQFSFNNKNNVRSF